MAHDEATADAAKRRAHDARPIAELHGTLVLSERDREVFFDLLVNPPTPTLRLRRAFRAAASIAP